jgi:hypothetical protein
VRGSTVLTQLVVEQNQHVEQHQLVDDQQQHVQ